MSKSTSSLFPLSLFTLSCLYATTNSTLAQVTSDSTVNTQVNQNGNVAEITGGQTRGGNLFHSFQDFSVPANNEAFFDNANDISNIFSRVTGGNISSIDGAIRANGSASLFLINPAGIIFGQNARLDIGGSFFGSTASSILFEDGEFSAVDNLEQPILTVNAPIGLGFRNNPAPIEVNSTASADFDSMPSFDDNLLGLRVPDGETFALAGGDITANSGGIVSIGGQITLGAVGEAVTLGLNFDNDSPIFEFPENLLKADVSLTNNAEFLVSGSGGGDLAITARNIEILEGSGLFAGIFSGLGSPDAQAGNINLQASESVTVDGITEDDDFSGVFNEVGSESIGNAGTLNITTTNLSVSDDAQISTSINGEGNGGKITINARESVSVDGASNNENGFTGIFSQVKSTGIGNSGQLEINANNLSVVNEGSISTSINGEGNGNEILINANESIVLENTGDNILTSINSNVEDSGIGNSGNITITTKDFSVIKGSQISASTLGKGNAGNVTINADNISFDGINTGGFPSGFFSIVEADAEGNAGNVNVTANRLSLTNGGQVSVLTFGEGDGGNLNLTVSDSITISDITETTASGLYASAILGSGDGGNIKVTTNNLTIQNQGTIRASNFQSTNRLPPGTGATGSIDIEARSVKLNSLGNISADSASGIGGNVSIRADSLTLDDRALISVFNRSGVGKGGNINLGLNETLFMRNNSTISAQAIGNANGGNLKIATDFIIAFPEGNNDIIASAEQGRGGNITIDAESLLGIEVRPLSPFTNDINASSQVQGLDGTVNITTPDINPIQGATELPTNVVESEQTAQQVCQANREAAAQNGLIISGKGGIAPEPGMPLNSLNVKVNGEVNPTANVPEPIETAQGTIQPARGVQVTETGEIILTAYRTDNSGERLPEIKLNCG